MERETEKKKKLKTAVGYCNIKTLRKRKKQNKTDLKELYKNVSIPPSFLKEKLNKAYEIILSKNTEI